MSSARSRAGAPGEMIPYHRLPINDKVDDILFILRDGVASFEAHNSEDKNLLPSGCKAWFCESHNSVATSFRIYTNTAIVVEGVQLMLQPYANNVWVESPPSEDLPILFDRIHVPSCKAKPKAERKIYLRSRDIIHFDDDGCLLSILACQSDHSTTTSFAEGVDHFAAAEVQVKSSITTGPGAAALNDDETEDEDDLDATVNTPLGDEESTPATSRPTEGLAVKDTPSRPFSRESNLIFSTAQDRLRSPNFIGDSNDADNNTPAARAGAGKGKRVKAELSEDAESQFVFPRDKGQTTYGNTPKSKKHAKAEILESPSKSDLPSEPLDDVTIKVAPGPRRASNRIKVDENTAVTMSSPNRKRSLAETDDEEEEEDAPPASTAPPTKKLRGRGRPAKEPRAVKTPQAQSGKPCGRPSKASKVNDDEEEVAEPPSSSGKLKRPSRKSVTKAEIGEETDDEEVSVAALRRKPNLSPDLDPRSNSTPQSSATTHPDKPPTKTILSSSKFANDKKAANWLKKHGAPIDDKKIPGKGSNFVCVVGNGVLSTTAKVLRSVALGKKVVTDEWLKNCMDKDQLLDLDPYVHDDLADTMTVPRSKLLEGKALFVTSTLERTYGQGFADIKELAAAVGSHRVDSGTAKKTHGMSDSTTVFLGDDGDDPDAMKLTQEEGRTVFSKNFLAQSIIRGELLVDDDEFKWTAKGAKGKKGKK